MTDSSLRCKWYKVRFRYGWWSREFRHLTFQCLGIGTHETPKHWSPHREQPRRTTSPSDFNYSEHQAEKSKPVIGDKVDTEASLSNEHHGRNSKLKSETMPTREAAAYHEAGHAIVAFANGLGVSSVGIGTDKEGRPEGWCDQQIATAIGMGKQFGAIPAAQMLAGVIAERIFAGELDVAHRPKLNLELVKSASCDVDCHWRQDALDANTIAYCAVGGEIKEMPALIVGAWRHAESELQSLWIGVEAIAISLLEKNQLSREEIREAVNMVLPGLVK